MYIIAYNVYTYTQAILLHLNPHSNSYSYARTIKETQTVMYSKLDIKCFKQTLNAHLYYK